MSLDHNHFHFLREIYTEISIALENISIIRIITKKNYNYFDITIKTALPIKIIVLNLNNHEK